MKRAPRSRLKLPAGKLPVPLLRTLLRYRGATDPAVVVGPGYGADAAVIDFGGRELLVLKSDPVTFTTDELGWYAVHVNANDVAVVGGRPRWFQPTIILPEGCDVHTGLAIARDIHRAARSLRISVTGGHTEVSPAVHRPIVAGDMQGLVRRDRLVRPGNTQPGDVLILTKSAGLEGTSILAREHATVARRVLGAAGQRRAARFHHDPGISIVRDAGVAIDHRATALHDPTEGGVATALVEMAAAARVRFVVDVDDIPVHPFTQRLCAYFDLRPLGLIASGALLASVPPARAPRLIAALSARRIAARIIGRAVPGSGIEARANGRRTRFVWSERDELTRVS